jgi:type II secretory pathway pseudopilin PulG
VPLAASRINSFSSERSLVRDAAARLSAPKSSGRKRGFTLVEAMIASVFLAVSVVGVSSALMASSNQSSQTDETTTAQGLAHELLEEMTARSFLTLPNQGHSAGVLTRLNYDDVADYDGYTDNTTNGITSLQGTPIAIGDGVTYTRTASFAYRATPGGSNVSSGDFGLATVTVTTPEGTSITLQRLLTNFATTR